MQLDLEDERLKAKISRISDGRTRLVLEYPAEPRYRNAVLGALSELLRPAGDPARSAEAPAPGEAA